MFDLDAGKLIIVGVAALVFIPSKDLPRVLRQVGQFVGKMKRTASDFQGQFMDAMREADMADLRQEARKLADAARVDTTLGTHARDLEQQIARPSPVASTASTAEAPVEVGQTLELPPIQPAHYHEAHPLPGDEAMPGRLTREGIVGTAATTTDNAGARV